MAKNNVQPAWIDGDNAGIAAQHDGGQALAAPAAGTPVNHAKVVPSKLVVPANAGNPHNPRSIDYAIHALQHAAKPATLAAGERAALVAKRDELVEQLRAFETEMANLDSEPLPEDVLAAINMQQERDARRIELGSAVTLCTTRLKPLADALAKDQAARDAIAANDAMLYKLEQAKELLDSLYKSALVFVQNANVLVESAALSPTGPGGVRGALAGVGAIPAVHFALQDVVALVGNANMRLGHVR